MLLKWSSRLWPHWGRDTFFGDKFSFPELLSPIREIYSGFAPRDQHQLLQTWNLTLLQTGGVGKVPEKAMAPHSSTLAWKIPWMEEPGRLQSMGSLRVWHDWVTSLSLFPFMHWRKKWQPTPVFLPAESQGWGSLVGCCLWVRTELDTVLLTQGKK